MENRDLYLRTKPSRLFFFAALPGSVSMLASSLYSLFDGILVGKLLGETAFAGINLGFPFVVINFALADLIGVGASVPISIALGKKSDKEANNYFSCACLLILLTGLLMGGVLYAAAPFLMALLGATGALAEAATVYVRMFALFSPLTTMTFALDNFLRICGKTKTSMFLNILMSGLSLALEFVFLFYFKAGIGAAALAMCLAMLTCVAIGLSQFLGSRLQLRFCRPVFSRRMLGQILSSGSPIFLSNITGHVTSLAMSASLLRMGGEGAVTVYGIMMYVSELIQPLLYGTYDSLQPAIGYNYGAGEYGRVKKLFGCCLAAGGVLAAVALGLMMGIPQTLARLFLQAGDSALLPLAVRAIRFMGLAFVTRWFWFAVQSLLVAVNRPLPATILSVSNSLVAPLALLAALWPLELTGLWLNAPLTSLLVSIPAVCMLWRLQRHLQ